MKHLAYHARALALAAFFVLLSNPSSAYPISDLLPCPDEIPSKGDGPIGDTIADRSLQFRDFKRFCDENQTAILCAGAPGDRLPFAKVVEIDAKLRKSFTYRSDMATAHVIDHWSGFTYCGDCEDYALTLSELLAQAGEGGPFMALQMMRVPVEGGTAGHASLFVETKDRGIVEIGVENGGEPAPVDWSIGYREAIIWMDGARQPKALPGYELDMEDYSVHKKVVK